MKNILTALILTGWISASFAQFNTNNDGNLPDDFPVPEILFSDEPSPGYFFLSPAGLWGYFPNATPYLVIMDNYGTPVFFEEQTSPAFDFKLQQGSLLTYAYGTSGHKHFVLNDKFEFVKQLHATGFYDDFHDLIILDNGNYLMLANEYRIVDMDTVVPGGQPGVTVVGGVIQIQDPNDNVLFHWSTFDHFSITDAGDNVDLTDPNSIDYAHVNSIEMDSDSTIILSSRNMHELTKIRISDGEIIWRMGGKNNMFTFNSDTSIFSGQHDFRKLPNGQYSLFDNNWFSGIDGSRASFYELDEENHFADLVKQYKSYPEPIDGHIMGNVQPLPNGNWVVGWGSGDPNFTEFKPDGSKALEVRYDAVSYRAFKFDWKPKAFTFNVDEAVFGEVSYIQPSTMQVTFSNNLDEDIEINYIDKHSDFFSVLTGLPIQVSANSEKTITLKFTPDNTSGVYEDLLTFCWDTENDDLSKRIAVQLPVKAEAVIGIAEDIFKDVRVYPNPFTDKIIISGQPGTEKELSVVIYNAMGQAVFQMKYEGADISINTAEFPKGVYSLQLQSGKRKEVRKLIKL